MKTKGDKSRILQGHVPSISPCVATKTLVYNIFKFFPSIFFSTFLAIGNVLYQVMIFFFLPVYRIYN